MFCCRSAKLYWEHFFKIDNNVNSLWLENNFKKIIMIKIQKAGIPMKK